MSVMPDSQVVNINSFSALKKQFDSEGLPYKQLNAEPTLTVPISTGGVESVMHIRWEPTPGIIQFIQPLPVKIQQRNYADVALLLNTINSRLAVLGFTLNQESGIVTYRVQAFLTHGNIIEAGLLGSIISTVAKTATQYFKEINHSDI